MAVIEKVDTKQMRDKATDLGNLVKSWETAVGIIDKLVQRQDSLWNGDAGDEFTLEQWKNKDIPKFTDLKAWMDKFVNAINTAAETYDRREGEIKDIMTH